MCTWNGIRIPIGAPYATQSMIALSSRNGIFCSLYLSLLQAIREQRLVSHMRFTLEWPVGMKPQDNRVLYMHSFLEHCARTYIFPHRRVLAHASHGTVDLSKKVRWREVPRSLFPICIDVCLICMRLLRNRIGKKRGKKNKIFGEEKWSRKIWKFFVFMLRMHRLGGRIQSSHIISSPYLRRPRHQVPKTNTFLA